MFGRHRTCGFSLIELMVAVAILVMAIFGIFHAFSSGFMGMTDARERTIATNLAQKVMEDIKSKNAISESGYDSETISGKTFDIVASYPEDDPNDVTVTVSWLDRNGNTKSVELNTIFYDLQAPLVEAEIGTIDLESDPDSESITCCDTLTIIATVKDSEGNLVYSNNPNAEDATFVVWHDKTQLGETPTGSPAPEPGEAVVRPNSPIGPIQLDTPTWIVYKSCMITVMRLNLESQEWKIRIYDRYGNDLIIAEDDAGGSGYPPDQPPPPPDPTLQTMIIVGIKPNYPL